MSMEQMDGALHERNETGLANLMQFQLAEKHGEDFDTFLDKHGNDFRVTIKNHPELINQFDQDPEAALKIMDEMLYQDQQH